MQVAIYGRELKDKDVVFVQELFNVLNDLEASIHIYKPYFSSFKNKIKLPKEIGQFESYAELGEIGLDFLISLGGDGTILNAATLVLDSNIPIVGINLGRLGFLATIDKNTIREAMENLLKGGYVLDERTLLQLECDNDLFGGVSVALNDFTIVKRDTSSMIIVHTYLNGEFLNSYWADGIIVSTPTGSTGYSLSCGGPIIYPNSGNFVITPVAPHNLNVRPFVISDTSVIAFEIEGRAKNFLCTLDSRYESVTASDILAIRKADFTVKLVRPNNHGFLSTIRDKLQWGLDSRN